MIESIYDNRKESSIEIDESKIKNQNESDVSLLTQEERFQVVSKPHIVFLQHGFMGNEEDMERIFSTILTKSRNCKVYSIKSTNTESNMGIFQLGKVAAKEMIYEIEKLKIYGPVEKITLVGYSLGGLILRAALKHMKKYKKLMHGFVTLATPHFGYFHTHSKLLSIGMWLIGGFKEIPSLNEIRHKDASNIEDTAIYKLSKAKGLEWFK